MPNAQGQGRTLNDEAEAKPLRPRPKFWPRSQCGLET